MHEEPSYEQLEQRVKQLEKETKMRRKAELALMHSEEKYRTLLEGIGDCHLEVDLSGNFQFYNDSFICIFRLG